MAAGPVGPDAKWFNASVWDGPFPTTAAAASKAKSYFAAGTGYLPTVPKAVAVVYSPKIRFWMQQQAYTNLKTWWQVCAATGDRLC